MTLSTLYTLSLLALTGSAALNYGEGGSWQQVCLSDYNTGSKYSGVLSGG